MKISTTRRGLTLIELTVVLLILAATAGILVPRLVGYSGRAHGASGASNVQEITKALALFEANNGAMPNNFDSLVEDDNSTISATVVATGVTNPFAQSPLTAAEATALNDIGITQLQHQATAGSGNATFEANSGTASPVAATEPVAVLTPASVADRGLPVGARVAVFGLGAQSSMIGTVMTDAPVHFPEGGAKPEDVYLRYYVLFRLDDGAGGTLERASLFGVFAAEPGSGELTDTGAHLSEYYENRDR